MKILLLNDDYPPEGQGGGASITASLAQGYHAAGHDVIVLTTHRHAQDTDSMENGIRVIRLALSYPQRYRAYMSLWNRAASRKVRHALASIGPVDAVHAHNVHTFLTYHSLWLAKRSAKKVILTFHDVMSVSYGRLTTSRYLQSKPPDFNYQITLRDEWEQAGITWNPLRNRLIRRALGFADVCVAVSQALADALSANGIPIDKVIHNGIDPHVKIDAAHAGVLRTRWNISANDRVIFFGGRLSGDKGIAQLYSAYTRIRSSAPAKILIVGDETKAKRLLDQTVTDPTMRNDFVVTGWLGRDDLMAALSLSDVCVTPSVCFDSFPTVNLEAMALGKPVIATWFGGSSELVQDGKTGYIVNPFAIEEFASRLNTILTDQALRTQMGDAGQKRIEHDFTLKKQVQSYIDLFQS